MSKKIKTVFNKFYKNKPKTYKRTTELLAVLIVAGIGSILIFGTHAQVPFVSLTASSGTTSGGATSTTCAGASGSTCVVFNGSSTTCPSGQVTANDGSCVALPTGTSKLVFDDEFSAASVNTSLWDNLYVHGDRSNDEPQCYIPSNVTESGGYLNETVEVENVTCPIDANNGGSGTLSSDYASGAIQMNAFNFTYGTIQARIKYAGGTGTWPALWLLGSNCQQPNYLATTSSSCNWPDPGSQEIDMAEIYGSASDNVNEGVITSGGTDRCYPSVSNVSQNWHVYQLVWAPGSLTFSIDGTTTCTLKESYIPSSAMFMILNLSVGGVSGGTINNSTLPQTTSIDYLRVFQ